MDKPSDFEIKFSGLADGIHNFQFDLDKTFFTNFDYLRVFDGNGKIDVEMEKKPTMLILNFTGSPLIKANCDRCGDDLETVIDVERNIIVKFSESQTSSSDEVMYISPNSYEMDLGQLLYEFVGLSIPNRLVHSEEDCNQEVILKLKDQNSQSGQEIDPRWEALKKIKDNLK